MEGNSFGRTREFQFSSHSRVQVSIPRLPFPITFIPSFPSQSSQVGVPLRREDGFQGSTGKIISCNAGGGCVRAYCCAIRLSALNRNVRRGEKTYLDVTLGCLHPTSGSGVSV
jgi:hypothetical protein